MGLIFVGVYAFYQIYIKIKSSESIIKVEYESRRITNILESFRKTHDFDRAEISISKEKKICVVCKKKIKRYSFVCPGCKSFYCNKCIGKVSDKFNKCLVCNIWFRTNLIAKMR